MYKYAGAFALVSLHEAAIRSFIRTWETANALGIRLPETDDPDYRSLKALLRHVLASSGGYLAWICDVLELDPPQKAPALEAEATLEGIREHVERLLEGWRHPLAGIEEGRFQMEHPSNWGPIYCVESMLEHAVMHPIRHEFQLSNLINAHTLSADAAPESP